MSSYAAGVVFGIGSFILVAVLLNSYRRSPRWERVGTWLVAAGLMAGLWIKYPEKWLMDPIGSRAGQSPTDSGELLAMVIPVVIGTMLLSRVPLARMLATGFWLSGGIVIGVALVAAKGMN